MTDKEFVMTLSHIPAATDEIFSFHNPDENKYYFFNASAIRRHIETCPHAAKFVTVEVTEKDYRHVRYSNGIEKAKLTRLLGAPEKMAEPVLFVDWEDGHQSLIDGNHRYCLLFQMGMKKIGAYMVPRRVWENFLVPFPQEMGEAFTKNEG